MERQILQIVKVRTYATVKKPFHLYSLASQVSALAALGSLPFGKATHASVVLRSILGFTRLTDASPLTLVNPQEHRAFLPFFNTHNLSIILT